MIIAYVYEFQAYPPKGGNHRHAYELVQGFLARSHTVRVMNDPLMPGAENYSYHQIQEFLQGIDILYVRVDARPLKNSIFEKLVSICEVPVVWEVNAPANETLAYSWLGDKHTLQKETIYRVAKRYLHAYRKYPGIYFEEQTRKSLSKKVHKHICVTSALEKYATTQLGAKSTIVIPNGGNPILNHVAAYKDKENTRKKTPFTVLYSGSALYPWQGLNYINDVTHKALKDHPDIQFIFCVPEYSEKIIHRINTKILIGLPHKDILDQIARADVCLALYPEYTWSPWGTHNSPMKLFEYFSCGAATITSNTGQMKELFAGKEITLLTENKPEDILHNILKIKDDPQLKCRLSSNAHKLIITEMNWENVVEKTLSTFSEALVHEV